MDHAIILASGTGIDEEELRHHGELRFGSLPQIKRLVITAQRAGIKKFTIITDSSDSALKDLLSDDKRIESVIEWHTPGEKESPADENVLVLQSNLITTPDTIENFLNSKVNDNDEINLLADMSADAWLKQGSEQKIAEIFTNGGRAVGALIVPGKIAEKLYEGAQPLKSLVWEYAEKNKLTFTRYTGKYWMRLTDEEDSARKAEDLIFNYVGKTATGWISRNINSKISLPTSRVLIRTPLTPNMISIGINIIGVFCGVFYAIGHPVLGAICMHIATILDRCDGEVARVKLMETKRGQWVDTISDQVTILSFLIGVPIGYYLQTNSTLAVILGSLNMGIFIFFVIWSFYFLSKYTDSGSLVTYFEVDKLVDEKKTSGIRKFIKLLRPLGRRNVYSLAFLIMAIFGGYIWILGFTSAALVLFLIHQLEDIIKLRKVNPENSSLK